MRLLKRMRRQDAIYWRRKVQDEYGEWEYYLPETIKIRWEDEFKQVLDPGGNEITSMATIYLGLDPQIGDKIMKGRVEDLPGPLPPEESREIRSLELIPTLRPKLETESQKEKYLVRIAYL